MSTGLIGSLKRALGIKPAAGAYPHPERDLARVLGLGHDALKAARAEQLARGRDWELVDGFVCYSPAGREKIAQALGLTLPATPAATASDSAPNATLPSAPWRPPVAGEVRELVCSRVPLNRRMIEARDGAAAAWVRVKDNAHFRVGMRLPARFVGGDKWELVGRCPRWPGKF